jgi:hypothetical protein
VYGLGDPANGIDPTGRLVCDPNVPECQEACDPDLLYSACFDPGGGPGGPGPSSPAAPCELELFTRPVKGGEFTGATHSYLVLKDPNGKQIAVVEGLWNRSTDQLTAGVDNKGNGASANNPAKDSITGGQILAPCDELDQIIATAGAFKPTTYHLAGPNSNSFCIG